jgi:hypothetical protein
MHILWISLPAVLDLQDVQAALNVVVTVLSAFCVFVFARACWQTATAKIVKNRNVPLPALLSVNTLGEVYDVCRLLGLEILSSDYLRILAQCVVVTGLTVLAFASGPIVRYSTRLGRRLKTRDVPGLIANRLQSGIGHESVLWNTTWESLDKAGFPDDQLLDFLPNSTAEWQYVDSQWNSSWNLDCELTENTAIALTVVQTTCNNLTTLNDQIPAFESIFPQNAMMRDNYSYPYTWFEGYQFTDNLTWSNLLMFRIAYAFLRNNSETGIWEDMELTLMSVHMQGVPGVPFEETYCQFYPGTIDSATFTKSFCKLKNRQPAQGKNPLEVAYPDHRSLDFVVKAYTDYFQGRYSRENIAGDPVTVITPHDLIRFFQVYQITQDIQYKHPNKRVMDVKLEVVKLSTIFVILCGVATLLCVFGILRYGVFTLRNLKAVDRTPQSKLDWMIQSIEKSQAGTPLTSGANASARGSRHSVTSMRSPDIGSPTMARRKSDFETATYGSSPTPSTPYHMNWLPRESSGGSYFPLQEVHEHPETSDASLLERYPTAPAGPLNHGTAPFSNDYYIHR